MNKKDKEELDRLMRSPHSDKHLLYFKTEKDFFLVTIIDTVVFPEDHMPEKEKGVI